MSLPGPIGEALSRYWQELRRYADFSGLTDWQSYGSFFAVNLLLTLFFKVMDNLRDDGFFAVVGLLYGFVVLLPGIAVTVRLLRYVISKQTSRKPGSTEP